jgi:heavy metal sensor kinase
MKRINTLRLRFALWTASLFLVILTAFGIFVYVSMERSLHGYVDGSLQLNAAQVIASLNIEEDRLILSDHFPEEPENTDLREQGYTIQILSPQEEVLQTFGLYQNLLSSISLTNFSPFFSTIRDPATGTRIRVYTTPVIEEGHFVAIVQVAQSFEDTELALQRLLLILLISVPLLVIISGLSGYWLAARTLRPIDQITSTARQISAKDLSARLNLPNTNDEVGRLASTFDNMLYRLDQSFQRERQFTTDASHELRTPLTAMQAVLGMMREKPRSTQEYQEALEDLSEEVDRLRTLTENLLHLARDDRKKDPVIEPVNLSTLLEDVSDSLTPLILAKGLGLRRDIQENLLISGDRDDLIRLFVNLLDNAIKFTRQGEISITAGRRSNAVHIVVKDTGIGIEPRHLAHIFDRFYRTDRARATRGSGLGLAIAKNIVERHGGKIEISSVPNQGSAFAIDFPC